VSSAVRAGTPDEVREAVRSLPRVRVRAGGSKDALSADATLEVAGLSGVLEYDPQEYTFTALAGTPLREVAAMLAEHGQYLPFDPPFQGTLGGTVAAGLSGPGRYRYGGVRDFLIGVTFVDGTGRAVTGGGKVVKNAAGFDFPKLMVGALGAFGVLTHLTFKVFPQPPAWGSLRVHTNGLSAAVALMARLASAPFELNCLELEPPGTLLVRVGGRALPERLARLQAFVMKCGAQDAEALDDEALWHQPLPPGERLVKLPLSPLKVAALEAALAWGGAPEDLDALLMGLGLTGLTLTGRWPFPYLGKKPDNAFLTRIRSALDPERKFYAA
jgi:glycolate oxidase FAD binding subunit